MTRIRIASGFISAVYPDMHAPHALELDNLGRLYAYAGPDEPMVGDVVRLRAEDIEGRRYYVAHRGSAYRVTQARLSPDECRDGWKVEGDCRE